MYAVPIFLIIVYFLAMIWFVYDTTKGGSNGRNRRR